MANSAQARKRARQSEKHNEHNAARRSMMRTAVKKVMKAVQVGDQETAKNAYQQAVPILDRMANKGLIHKNKAARYKSRLNNHVRAMA